MGGVAAQTGWYPDPSAPTDPFRCRWWDGGAWGPEAHWDGQRWLQNDTAPSQVVGTPPSQWPPKWYPDPLVASQDDGAAERYWDGSQWTSRTRQMAATKWVAIVCAMAAVGLILSFVPWPGFPADRCDYSAGDPYMTGWAMLRWLLYLAMGVAGFAIWRSKGRHDWRIVSLAVLGVLAALLQFPPFMSLTNALDCGL